MSDSWKERCKGRGVSTCEEAVVHDFNDFDNDDFISDGPEDNALEIDPENDSARVEAHTTFQHLLQSRHNHVVAELFRAPLRFQVLVQAPDHRPLRVERIGTSKNISPQQ